MTLEFNKLTTQLAALGQITAEENADLVDKKRLAGELFRDAAQAPHELRRKVMHTRNRQDLDWHGAYPPEPVLEPLNAGIDCPTLSEPVTLIAADGSQIYPDQHAPALYYLINIGAISLRVGSGQTPQVLTQPHLYHGYTELHDEQGNLIRASVVDARRHQAEFRTLAELAEKAAPPVVALRDGPLLLWGYLEDTPGAERRMEPYIAETMQSLDRLRASNAAIAGYVDRSLRADVSKLLNLSTLSFEQLTREYLTPEKNVLQGLTDKDVFSFLQPGQRSARFIIQSRINKTYTQYGHEIWFFYVNLSSQPDQPELARVEVPAWVAQDDGVLNRVHAALVQQSQILEGAPYPYALARADELAVVGAEEKEHLEGLIVRELIQRRQAYVPSRKARSKEQARGGRRRHEL
jgi:hypothetical protein